MQPDQMFKTLFFVAFLTWAAPALPHGDEDHGPPAVAVQTSSIPRAIATSEDYEVVASLNGEDLLIYIDRFADNSPVTSATLAVTIGTKELQTELTAEGVYRLHSKELLVPGGHDIIFAIQDGSKSDLLITSISVPELATAIAPAVESPPSVISRLKTALLTLLSQVTQLHIALAAGAVAVFALFWRLLRRRQRIAQPKAVHSETDIPTVKAGMSEVAKPRSIRGSSAAAAAVLVLLLSYAPKVMAHGDEDHGDPKQPVAFSGDAPRRLPDASVYLPKLSQRLLEVRTLLAKETSTQPSHSFAGRVIADPSRFGVVQSTLGGRITTSKGGLPRLGQAVKAGEVLGYVAPYIAAIDRSDAAQTAGNLEQEIALAENRLVRAKRLFAVNAGTRVQVEEREIELEGLKKRRAAIAVNTTKPEPLVAPIDGVIATAKVVAGQVVESKDVLYEIIDPSSLWVEAFVFEQSAPQTYSESSAVAQDGETYRLDFIGRSRALRQQSTVLQFAIQKPPASLNVGVPVTVLVRGGDPVDGIVLPKTAIVRAANGENIVWQHKEAERFVATPVKVSNFDGERMLVERGLKAGERVVVQGAELINQVR